MSAKLLEIIRTVKVKTQLKFRDFRPENGITAPLLFGREKIPTI